MSRCRIKICGITRVEDALTAAQLGVDAIGLVFYEQSPRAVTIAQAQRILQALPPFITTVGLFVDAAPAVINAILQQLPLDVLQFHGSESPAQCRCYARPYVKAVRMRPNIDLPALIEAHAEAQGLLLDTYLPGVAGGSGQTFDWSQVPNALKKPIILAGGLNSNNVAQAIHTLRPYAVDVSGGVEAEVKGIKSAAKMAAFVEAVRQASVVANA